jgi:DNA-binding response OmpR family regulator
VLCEAACCSRADHCRDHGNRWPSYLVLDSGATDYLVKPFSQVRLRCSIRAAAALQERSQRVPPAQLRDLSVDTAAQDPAIRKADSTVGR